MKKFITILAVALFLIGLVSYVFAQCNVDKQIKDQKNACCQCCCCKCAK